MNYEIQQAFNEIMEITPIYRRDYIVEYLRKNLPKDDARRHLFAKTKTQFIAKMIAEGYVSKEDLLEKIGRERIEQYFHYKSTLA